ncbi:heavy metal translocating P-type ATPase [Propionibacterium australiense]|uniref:Cation-transporting P-type ATPase B n=1 Tax=Propionibacterium australiense TaxID=119981 RepID=A0A383S987_9ACTN|nr:heavy metal translocating P-type ATPase [Propionibacterium australiense]RLP07508.1 heavy metal translocating P-type ATPase [Propionibacterium australiense]SYZ34112.1 Copper-transporting ATPase signature [Propionibacterium australiense]VEH88701.1 Copper-exporting P-type ATPase A [Propionibacterium australiense]
MTDTARAEPGAGNPASQEFSSIDLDVQGMTCASCAARIQKKLNKVDGVQAAVNYATAKAHVLAPHGTDADSLIEVVRAAGYDASLPDPGEDAEARAREHAERIRRRLVLSACIAVPVMLVSMITPLQFPGWQWVVFALTTPVLFWGGWGFHRSAWVNLRHGAFTMDTLISVGTLAAYLWSAYCLVFGNAGTIGMKHPFSLHLMRADALDAVYFEAACGTITFILLGRWIEARSKSEAGSALRELLMMGARHVHVLDDDGTETTRPIEALRVGQRFVVRPGEKVASDGDVVEGNSAIDAHVITGESVPVEVGPGDHVVGATLNTNGRLVVQATAVGADTQLSQIAHLVEQAQTGKSNAQRLADRIAAVFVPVVIGLALITLLAWLLAGAGVSFAVTAGVSVLIISCPCALGLATPTALLAGTGRGAQLGVLIRGPEALERARAIDTVVMDKTGTLTKGEMSVQRIVPAGGEDDSAVLANAAALEAGSEHPIAEAIVARAAERGAVPQAEDFRTIPGRGVQAVLDGTAAFAGSSALMADQAMAIPAPLAEAADSASARGATVVFVAWAGAVRGVIAVSDEIAANSARAVERFHALGLRTVMLTGDNERAAGHVAAQVGIDEVHAQVLPEQKLSVVNGLRGKGHRVAMIGDGVNDAAALAAAELGIAMGTGTDAAIAASDLTLMRHDLMLAVDAIALSRATLRTIRGNLFWAFFYNVCAIPIAVAGLLNPMIAGAAMAFSSVFVVTNSLRLRGFQPNR